VSVHQWSLSRSPSKFYRPDDFLPERWLDSAKDKDSPFKDDQLSGAQAFSVGSWSCIGKGLAYGELRMVLARLVWNFELRVAPGGRNVKWDDQKCWFLTEKEPFDVELTPRRILPLL
jgi:cytochrome P450